MTRKNKIEKFTIEQQRQFLLMQKVKRYEDTLLSCSFDTLSYADSFSFCDTREKIKLKKALDKAWQWGTESKKNETLTAINTEQLKDTIPDII